MDGEEDLELLTALLAESEPPGEGDALEGLFDQDPEGEYREEGEGEEGEEGGGGEEGVGSLFGDIDDIEDEEKVSKGEEGAAACENLNRSKEDLEEELRRMQEQMQRLQQQLEASQRPPGPPQRQTPPKRPGPDPAPPGPPQRQTPPKRPGPGPQPPPTPTQPTSPPGVQVEGKLQDSSDFCSQLSVADSFQRRPRVARPPKAGPRPDPPGLKVEVKMGSSFLPEQSSSRGPPRPAAPPLGPPRPAAPPPAGAGAPPPPPKDVAVEKYSGLRLRNPRVSSGEMDSKMAAWRLVRLPRLPEALQQDGDWVTFGVLLSKATPQSSSGKPFSVWRLGDLSSPDLCVSLFLFGDLHQTLWKTEPGTVVGLLNPNALKPRDGHQGVSLTVDHPQKVLVLGEALDFGCCKAPKKNGEPCSQVVNTAEGPFCQYHVQAQHRRMSSSRAELQSCFSGRGPPRGGGGRGGLRARGGGPGARGGGLRERLCQDGFHYGGVSSAAFGAALTPRPKTQRTLDLFVSGSAQLVRQAKKIALQAGEVSGCSQEFQSLMSAPTPGALQLKRHLTQDQQAASKASSGSPLCSISAADLLKQQKQKQRLLLEARRQRAQTHPPGAPQGQGPPGAPQNHPPHGAPQNHPPHGAPQGQGPPGALQNHPPPGAPQTSPPPGAPPQGQGPPKAGSPGAGSTRAGSSLPNSPPLGSSPSLGSSPPLGSSPSLGRGPPLGSSPSLGRGFSEGDDILFFDQSPPPALSTGQSAAKAPGQSAAKAPGQSAAKAPGLSAAKAPGQSAAKAAALRKLKGAGLERQDPNALKRKRSSSEISARVERDRAAEGEASSQEETSPAQKKKRDQLRYLQSEEFQKILGAKSRHGAVLQAAEYQLQQRYFDALVRKEQMEEKMRGIKEMKCRAVSCKKCGYTFFQPAQRCVDEQHDLRWHPATKRFFRCSCGQRAVALDRLPHRHCSNCGQFRWERDSMLKERCGPRIGGELLQPRGEEHAKFLNSIK